MHIYSSTTVEPGGFDLRDDDDTVECPECSETAAYRSWESAAFGSLETYFSIRCKHCGHVETNWSEP